MGTGNRPRAKSDWGRRAGGRTRWCQATRIIIISIIIIILNTEGWRPVGSPARGSVWQAPT